MKSSLNLAVCWQLGISWIHKETEKDVFPLWFFFAVTACRLAGVVGRITYMKCRKSINIDRYRVPWYIWFYMICILVLIPWCPIYVVSTRRDPPSPLQLFDYSRRRERPDLWKKYASRPLVRKFCRAWGQYTFFRICCLEKHKRTMLARVYAEHGQHVWSFWTIREFEFANGILYSHSQPKLKVVSSKGAAKGCQV